ncbi:MAG TPA: ATP-grasp domain-containing protein [Gemmataceae bacterium]|nr:ATP-grasp domain-containing protein [Gemmataceae bacterium]
MQLLYDPRDAPIHQKLGSRLLDWLDDLGAKPIDETDANDEAFLFTGARPMADYRRLVTALPFLRDRPEERETLLRLDTVLEAIKRANVKVPMPRTWLMPLDVPLPDDLTYPLFLRTAETSWKKGGRISKVQSHKELEAEAAELRRAFGWDATILAREWLDLASAGKGNYGPVAQEVRIWIVDQEPFAWSFHFMNIVSAPKGFPPGKNDLNTLRVNAAAVAPAFESRLVAADFAKGRDGRWYFIEAGPGSCAGTSHEAVFKAVAGKLMREALNLPSDRLGGLL